MRSSPSLASVVTHRDRRTRVSLRPIRPSNEKLTRALDIVIAAAMLIFLGPLMLVIAAAILVFDRGPIIVAHRRLGRDGQGFPCLKFRTMVSDAQPQLVQLLATDADARAKWSRDFKLQRDPRFTRLGLLLRQSSLDELPQLLNVLRGEMAIVGPRPISDAEIDQYGRYFQYYSSVKPGLTGLWQISGRGDLGYRRRIAMDVAYARNKSPGLDLRILLLTIPAVLLGRGGG